MTKDYGYGRQDKTYPAIIGFDSFGDAYEKAELYAIKVFRRNPEVTAYTVRFWRQENGGAWKPTTDTTFLRDGHVESIPL